jgi:peroxiredoxin
MMDMRRYIPVMTAALAMAVCGSASANLATGGPARDFKLRDTDNNVVSLSQYRGKTVVVEWHNPECPFVKKHYNSGNMQATQAGAKAQGAVWLTVNSSAPGKQGHMNGAQAAALAKTQKLASTEYLLDPSGVVGKAWAAKTTPHLFIVDGTGKLRYQGAIDDKPTPNPADVKGARNHVTAALAEIKAGKAVSVAETKPYGCSVKYSDS